MAPALSHPNHGPRIRRIGSTLVLLAGLEGVSCGSGRSTPSSPSAVTPPSAPSSFKIVSGETGQPVGGATVVVAGQSLRSDAQGIVSLPAGSSTGALVDLVASGFLDRQTLLREGSATALSLWPRNTASGMDENFTATLVYTSTADGSVTGAVSMIRHRPTTTAVTVVLSPELAADAESLRWHQLAADSLNTAVEGKLIYRVTTERPTAGVVIDVTYDPSNSGCAGGVRGFASRRTSAGEITGGSVVYCASDAPRSGTVVHELGHTFGLGHSPDTRDVMYFSFVRGRSDVYTPKEALAMKLMMARPPATKYPDNDRETSGASVEDGVQVIRCR